MFKKIIKYLSNILIGILILFCLYAVTCTAILKQKYVNVFGYTFFVVASGSMTGTIDVNDMVIVKITDEFETNDVITFIQDDYFVTHRVISSKNDKIITKGDANNTEDEPITVDDVVGKVVFVFPFSSLFQILGAIVLIVIVVVVFNFESIFKKYIFTKSLLKPFKNYFQTDVDDNEEYSELMKKILDIIKSRSKHNIEKPMTEIWVKRLRYVTKFLEIIKMEQGELLYKLVNNYPLKEVESDNILPAKVIMLLSEETLVAHIILMFNSIMYKDEEIFTIIFMSFKMKVNREFGKKNRRK